MIAVFHVGLLHNYTHERTRTTSKMYAYLQFMDTRTDTCTLELTHAHINTSRHIATMPKHATNFTPRAIVAKFKHMLVSFAHTLTKEKYLIYFCFVSFSFSFFFLLSSFFFLLSFSLNFIYYYYYIKKQKIPASFLPLIFGKQIDIRVLCVRCILRSNQPTIPQIVASSTDRTPASESARPSHLHHRRRLQLQIRRLRWRRLTFLARLLARRCLQTFLQQPRL